MGEYREGQLAIVKTRRSGIMIAGRVTLETGEPRFLIAHPEWPDWFHLPLDDTDDYRIHVLIETLDEIRTGSEQFDLCYRYANSVLDELPDWPSSAFVLTTAAFWILHEKTDPELLRSPDRTPIPDQKILSELVEKASAMHLEFMEVVADSLPSRVLN